MHQHSKSEVQVKSILARLRKGFSEDANRLYTDRVRNLKAFQSRVRTLSQRMQESVERDLSRCGFLTTLTEIEGLVDCVDYYLSNLQSLMADEPKDLPAFMAPGSAYIRNEPFGVALVIGSWNFPFATTLHPMIGAIAAGNCVCIKPSEMAEHSSATMKELIDGLDQRVFGCIEGGAEIAIALLEERWDVIAFTGSPQKGKLIAAAAAKYLTPTVLELGGKNPVIVDQDVNMKSAVNRIVQGRFLNAGQLCISPDMALVHASRVDEFIACLRETIREFFGDQPKNSKDYARIINDMHTNRIAALLEGHKGQVVIGGEVDLAEKYIAPTVVLNPDRNSPLGTEEVFGPVLSIFSFSNFDECIELINSRDKPLALYYFGKSSKNMERLKNSTSSGNLTWNDCVFHYACHDLPFGGVGTSGISKMYGVEGFRAMSHPKSIVEKYSLDRYPLTMRYPPHTEEKQRKFMRLKHVLGFSLNAAKKNMKRAAIVGVLVLLAYKGHLDPLREVFTSISSYGASFFAPKH